MADGEGKEVRPQTWLLGGALTTLTTILAALGAVELGWTACYVTTPNWSL
jgi:hypothetical protein